MAAVILALTAWAQQPEKPLPAGAKADLVVIRKAERRLDLYRGERLLKSYPISLGRNPVGRKRQEGDGRTPEGEYRLDDRKSDSAFHRALHISYPAPTDTESARARGVSPGGFVMIHGMKNGLGWLGRLHLAIDWTDGCVAVTNLQIEEISRAVPDGTKILLKP